MDKIAITRAHLFFRWRGRTGAAGAFTGRYPGGEALIAKLASLSPIHVVAAAAAPPIEPPREVAAIAAADLVVTRAYAARLPDRTRAPEDDMLLVVLPASSPADLVEVARRACGERGYCKYIGWTDPRRKADRWPISGQAIDAISFSYSRASKSGPELVRWNCREFPRADASQCLLRGI